MFSGKENGEGEPEKKFPLMSIRKREGGKIMYYKVWTEISGLFDRKSRKGC